jgi:ketosteroid isomerase-like protein
LAFVDAVFMAKRVTRLPMRSRLRRYLVARRTCQGFQGVNRGDIELLLTVYHDDVITRFAPSGLIPPDLVGEHRGRDGFRRLFENWQSAWDDLKVEPRAS